MKELTEEYLINGPNNIVRLTDGNKILYIFGDWHLNTENQNECYINDQHNSIDIDKLLFSFMKSEKNREFDLFIEMFEYLDPSLNTVKKKRYIDNVNKLFNSRIEFKDNKILTIKPYLNFRFHYFDIRNLLFLSNELLWNYSYRDLIYPYSFENLNNILNFQIRLNILLNQLLDYYNNSTDKVIQKIKIKYVNERIKEKINFLFNELIINNIILTIKLNDKFIKLLKKSIEKINLNDKIDKTYMKIQSKIFVDLYNIKNNISRIYLVTTDLNFLRRFLDKDYIKNTIIYTGLEHLSDLTYILIKNFNFKLTNIYYKSKEINFDSINNNKNFEYIKELNIYFENLDKNHNIIQCSNLFNFPINFS